MINQQKILIVEGVDMTGKSHIVKRLSCDLGLPRFKAANEHETFLKSQDRFLHHLRYSDTRLVDFLAQTGHSVIFDRHYPSEYVYSHVLGRSTDHEMLKYVDSAYSSLKTKILICYRDSYVGIRDDLDPRIDQFILEKLDVKYREFAVWTKCNVMFLETSDHDIDSQTQKITDWMAM
jgi:thymidylate kinase